MCEFIGKCVLFPIVFIGALLFALIISVPFVVLETMMLTDFWNWFSASLYRPITMTESFGIIVCVQPLILPLTRKEKPEEQSVVAYYFYNLFGLLLAYGIVALIHYVMPYLV